MGLSTNNMLPSSIKNLVAGECCSVDLHSDSQSIDCASNISNNGTLRQLSIKPIASTLESNPLSDASSSTKSVTDGSNRSRTYSRSSNQEDYGDIAYDLFASDSSVESTQRPPPNEAVVYFLAKETSIDHHQSEVDNVYLENLSEGHQQPQGSYVALRLTYLLVTLVIMLADGLQGMSTVVPRFDATTCIRIYYLTMLNSPFLHPIYAIPSTQELISTSCMKDMAFRSRPCTPLDLSPEVSWPPLLDHWSTSSAVRRLP
jgi:hypothetical protein